MTNDRTRGLLAALPWLLGLVALLILPVATVLSGQAAFGEDEVEEAEEPEEGAEAEEAEDIEFPWVVDVAEGKAQAAREGKDLFINFTGSDWCGWCKRLDAEVFHHAEFIDEAQKHFVFLFLDKPRSEELRAKVVDPELNQQLFDLYEADGYPTIILATADGTPYARTGYQPGGPEGYLEHLAELRAGGEKVKALIADESHENVEILQEAFPVLVEQRFLSYPDFTWVMDAAEQADPDGELGMKPLVEAERVRLLALAEEKELQAILPQGPGEEPDWEKIHGFLKDAKYMQGAMYLSISFALADWLLNQDPVRTEEARAVLEKAAQDELAQSHPRAKQFLDELMARVEEQESGETTDDDESSESEDDESSDEESDDSASESEESDEDSSSESESESEDD